MITISDAYWLMFGCATIHPTTYLRHGPIPRDLAHSIAALEGSQLVVYWDDGKTAWLGTRAAASADVERDLWPVVFRAVRDSIAGALMNKEQLWRLTTKLVRERDAEKLKRYGVVLPCQT